jgi:choice-of-anchor B domain-containing protein
MRFGYVLSFAAFLVAAQALAQAGAGESKNVTLLGRSDQYQAYSNIWGYTSTQGKEYALLGTNIGLSIVDISDPRQPAEAAFVPGPGPTSWREIKTWSHYAYVVSEAITPAENTGIQIVDLAQLPQVSYFSVYWPNVSSSTARAHSISVDEAGYLYIQGGSSTYGAGKVQGGIRIFSLANPEAPAPVGVYAERYVHDSFVKNNLLFNSNIQDDGRVDILDITDRAQPKLLTSIVYPGGASHNSGTTEDGNYLLTTDESTGRTVKFWDIHVLWDNDAANDDNIELVAEYIGNTSQIAHNVHVKGNYAYIAHYVEGVKVLDISNPRQPIEVGSFDTYPQAGSGYAGDWGVFPYFASGNFVVSDMQTGLYVLRLELPTSISDPEPSTKLPRRFELSPVFPNPLRLGPSRAESILQYELPERSLSERVTLKVYDLLGREVRTLVDEAHRPGKFSVRWNGLDQRGTPVTTGVYFLKLASGTQQKVRKLMVVR